MKRYWTTHWRSEDWNDKSNTHGARITLTGSNMYRKRGISPGDVVYVVSQRAGKLLLGGRLVVKAIVSRKEAVRLAGKKPLFPVRDWATARSATNLDLNRSVAAKHARLLRFVSPSGELRQARFVSASALDRQATRGVRELNLASARLLDSMISGTKPHKGEPISLAVVGPPPLPDLDETFSEGGKRIRTHLFVERNKTVIRKKKNTVLKATGRLACEACGFDFRNTYGGLGKDFCEVHHRLPLSKKIQQTKLADLAIVCSNCHRIIHRQVPLLKVEKLKRMLGHT